MAKQKTDINIEEDIKVKEMLDERGILMKDFAEKIGIQRETLTRALKGNPQYSTLKSIAEGLEATVPELFKVQSTKTDVHGCIYFGGEAHLVKSKEDIETLLEAMLK